jgi:hypothetical protein
MCLSQAVKVISGELLVVVGFESMGRTDPNQSGGQARDQYSLERQQVCRRLPVTSSSHMESRRVNLERHARAYANDHEALPTRDTVSQLSEAGPDRACRLQDEGRRRDPARQERLA